jgi:hypothetical protein
VLPVANEASSEASQRIAAAISRGSPYRLIGARALSRALNPSGSSWVATAVAALTRAMAPDHAAGNIRVNSVAPGVVWSSYPSVRRPITSKPKAS